MLLVEKSRICKLLQAADKTFYMQKERCPCGFSARAPLFVCLTDSNILFASCK